MFVYLTPRFKSQLKKLRKTYRRASDDVEELVSALEAGERDRAFGFGALREGKHTRFDYRIPRLASANAVALESSITLAPARYPCF